MNCFRTDRLKAEVAALEAELAPKLRHLEQFRRDLSKSRSLDYIKENNLHEIDVEMHEGKHKPYFSTIYDFVTWLNDKELHPRWIEWNTIIYELRDGKIFETDGRSDHLAP